MKYKYTNIILLLFGIPYIQTTAIGIDGYCRTNKVVKTTNGTGISGQKFCCRHYEEHLNKCKGFPITMIFNACHADAMFYGKEGKECKKGYTSTGGEPCRQCDGIMYGKRCAFSCKCPDDERCDHVEGCVATRGLTTYKYDNKKNDKRITTDQESKDNVVIYMTCIAALGLIVVGSITAWKFRQTLYQSISSWKNRLPLFVTQEISQQKKYDTDDNHLSSKLEQESMYDVINEEEMVLFSKTY